MDHEHESPETLSQAWPSEMINPTDRATQMPANSRDDDIGSLRMVDEGCPNTTD